MAHNALILGGTGSGAWAGITPGNLIFEQIDQLLFESVNGDKGGTWAPVAAIIIGGAGLELTAGLTVSGGSALIEGSALTVLCPATFGDTTDFLLGVTFETTATLLVKSAATFQGSATFTAGIAVDANSLFTTGTYTFSATGLAVFNSIVTVNAGLNVATGLLQVQSATKPVFGSGLNLSSSTDSLDVSGPAIFNKNITLGSVSSVLHRIFQAPNGDTTILANTYDVIVPTTLTASHTCTINDAPNGTVIRISMVQAGGSGAFFYHVKDQGGFTIIDLQDAATSGHVYSATIARIAGAWYYVDYSIKP